MAQRGTSPCFVSVWVMFALAQECSLLAMRHSAAGLQVIVAHRKQKRHETKRGTISASYWPITSHQSPKVEIAPHIRISASYIVHPRRCTLHRTRRSGDARCHTPRRYGTTFRSKRQSSWQATVYLLAHTGNIGSTFFHVKIRRHLCKVGVCDLTLRSRALHAARGGSVYVTMKGM